jgi:hypothetical protein
VLTFFNFEASDKTNIAAVHTDGIKPFIEKSKEYGNSPYSSIVFPNITILPASKSVIKLGENCSDGENQNCVLDGVYLDASYVAAGMTAAWMNPKELKERGFTNVDQSIPGARFDIENGDNNMIFTSSVSIESSKSYPENVRKELDEKGFGFVFSSDYIRYNNLSVDKLFVYQTRSLYEKNEVFQPIYKQLTKDLFRDLVEIVTQRKQANVKNFVRNSLDYFRDNRIAVNGLLQGDDEVIFENNEIHFSFSGMDEKIEITIIDN